MINNHQDPEDFPVIPDDLLEALDRTFPERCAALGMTEQEVFFQAGCRHVVRWLQAMHDEQNNPTEDDREEEDYVCIQTE